MNFLYQLTIVFAFSCFLSLTAHGQVAGGEEAVHEADTLSHCSLFYVKSFSPEILPFADDCFVRDRYMMHDYKHIRLFGPIEESRDLFRKYGWSMNFYLGNVKGDGPLTLFSPQNWLVPEEGMKDGQLFFYLSDDRSAFEFGRSADHVDYVPVSGKIKVTDFQPKTGAMEYPYFNVQLDMMMRRLDRTGGGARLTGPEVRLKAILLVQETE